MKTDFLVVYDYGKGGVWAYLLAETPEQVRVRFPELQVVAERPAWMTDEDERRTRERMTIDIDDTTNPFLAALIEDRSRAQ